MISQSCTRASVVEHGTLPTCFSGSPRDIVRFQYLSEGSNLSVRCFWILVAIASPIEPRPIHPSRGEIVVAMLDYAVACPIRSVI
jgi:hypothetical protein